MLTQHIYLNCPIFTKWKATEDWVACAYVKKMKWGNLLQRILQYLIFKWAWFGPYISSYILSKDFQCNLKKALRPLG